MQEKAHFWCAFSYFGCWLLRSVDSDFAACIACGVYRCAVYKQCEALINAALPLSTMRSIIFHNSVFFSDL